MKSINFGKYLYYVIVQFIPKQIKRWLLTISAYKYDMEIYFKYSNTFTKNDTANKIKGALSMSYHIVEKGLTMPEVRMGFGKEIIEYIIHLCKVYSKKKY